MRENENKLRSYNIFLSKRGGTKRERESEGRECVLGVCKMQKPLVN